MKKIVFILTIISSGGVAGAQTISGAAVPAVVLSSFASIYPNSKVEKWEKEDAFYEARFEKDKKIMYMTITATGEWVDTKTEIRFSELPALAGEYISKNYKGKHIINTLKIVNAAGGEVSYKVKLADVALFFNSEGAYKKSETLTAEERPSL